MSNQRYLKLRIYRKITGTTFHFEYIEQNETVWQMNVAMFRVSSTFENNNYNVPIEQNY